MSKTNNIPSWLHKFRLTIEDKNGTLLFDSDNESRDQISFKNDLGAFVGERLMVENKEYIISKIGIYSSSETSIHVCIEV